MMPSSAALQKVLGHMGAVAMRLTLLVWSENIWMVSFTDRSCTWTFVSAAPVIKILSPEWGRNCMDTQNSINWYVLTWCFDPYIAINHRLNKTVYPKIKSTYWTTTVPFKALLLGFSNRVLIHWFYNVYALDHRLIEGFKHHIHIILHWHISAQCFNLSTSVIRLQWYAPGNFSVGNQQ